MQQTGQAGEGEFCFSDPVHGGINGVIVSGAEIGLLQQRLLKQRQMKITLFKYDSSKVASGEISLL